MMNRLFITLDIPEVVLDEISTLVKKHYGSNYAKWEPRNKLHITLKFLGDTEVGLIDDICARLETISNENDKFNSEFNRFGLFFRNNKPKIFWIGIEENDKLKDLQISVEENISELGFKKEKRKFHPHLTLLRVRGKENFDALTEMKNMKIDPIKFTAEQISLIKSELKPSGSVYTTIKSFELR